MPGGPTQVWRHRSDAPVVRRDYRPMTSSRGRSALADVLNLYELEELARAEMDPGAFDYYRGGAGDEVTLRANSTAFASRYLRPRVLRDVSIVEPATSMLGLEVSMPVGLAPAALHKLAHPDGELATVRAAADAGVLTCLSTLSSTTLEDVASVAPEALWFQLYVHKDRAVGKDLMQRAEGAGYRALVLTADLAVPGYRERELRSHFVVPDEAAPANFAARSEDELIDVISDLHDRTLSWSDLEWMRDCCALPLVIKGILTEEDARLAVEHGAAGVWVSNHGGRQLDHAPPTIAVLERIVDAVDGRAEIYLDGGVRRGTDVVMSLALGATAVFVGRPYLYGLAAAGQAGVARVLELLRAEIVTAMTLIGARSIDEITRAHVG